jgi:serine/threonine protein kinase
MDEGLSLIVSRADFTIASLCGPCRWMPPEVLDPSDQYYEYDTYDSDSDTNATSYISPFTRHSDVYALGMTILEVFTGKAPYHHRRYDTVVILDIIRGTLPPRPGPDLVSDGLWALLSSCWQARPENRPTSRMVELWLDTLWLTEGVERLYK